MSLTRDTLKHTAIYSSATLLGKSASFFMLPFYAHIFQSEGYGVIGIIDASLGFLTILFASGFHVAITRIYHEEDGENKKRVISTAIWLIWVLGLITIPLPMLFSRFISSFLLGDAQYYGLVCLALITFAIDVSGQSAGTFLVIRQRSMLYSVVGIVKLFVGLGLNIWLVIILDVGLIGVFITSLINAVIGSIIFHWIAARSNGTAYDPRICRKLLKFQLPLMPSDFIAYASRQAERFLVRFFINLQGVGILEMAYSFPPLLNLIITHPFALSWRTKSMEIARQEDAPEIIGRMFSKYLYIMGFGALLMSVAIEDVIEIMTPVEFWGAVRIAKIEIMTTVLAGATTYIMFGLLYSKETKTIAVIRSVCAVIKIGLSFLFITMWGLLGAACSALITEIIILAWISWNSQRSYPIRIEYAKIAIIILSAVGIGFAVSYVDYTNFWPAIYLRTHALNDVRLFLSSTPLGAWKDGKLIGIFQARETQVVSLAFNLLFAMSYLFLLPVVQPGFAQSALRRFNFIGLIKLRHHLKAADKTVR